MNDWKIIHTYNNLVIDGKARALLCPESQDRLVIVVDPHIEEPTPALYCYPCHAIFRPGLDFWQQIRAVVAEHYMEVT